MCLFLVEAIILFNDFELLFHLKVLLQMRPPVILVTGTVVFISGIDDFGYVFLSGKVLVQPFIEDTV